MDSIIGNAPQFPATTRCEDADTLPPIAESRAERAPLSPSLSVWTGYLMGRVTQQCRDYFDVLAEPLGVKAKHFSVLSVLGEGQALSQVEMGERLSIDRNTIVLLLDDLEGLELVSRRRDPSDRRAHRVSLTGRGRETLDKMVALARRTNDEVLSPLSREERAQLHALLSRLF